MRKLPTNQRASAQSIHSQERQKLNIKSNCSPTSRRNQACTSVSIYYAAHQCFFKQQLKNALTNKQDFVFEGLCFSRPSQVSWVNQHYPTIVYFPCLNTELGATQVHTECPSISTLPRQAHRRIDAGSRRFEKHIPDQDLDNLSFLPTTFQQLMHTSFIDFYCQQIQTLPMKGHNCACPLAT